MTRLKLSSFAFAAGVAVVLLTGCGSGGNGIVGNSPEVSSRNVPTVDGTTVFKEQPRATEGGFEEVRGITVPGAATATVNVDSTPQGAEIFINGNDTGKITPATVSVAAGTVTLKLTKPDYKDFSITFRAVAGKTYAGIVRLQSTRGTLVVDSVPQGAEIFINGSDSGNATPATLSVTPGMTTVKLTKPGCSDFAASLNVSAGKTYQGKVTLKPGLRGFDGARAFNLLVEQVNFGPRVPGTAAHDTTRDYLVTELKKVTDSTEQQTFAATLNDQPVTLTNIIGVIQPATTRKPAAASGGTPGQVPKKILLCAHWDTRPVANMDPNPANRNTPIPGANDGASGVALLLEAARLLKANPPSSEVILVLFDAEDSERFSEMFTGSKYFAANMGNYRPDAAILLDMIGDANLNVNREENSLNSDPTLYNAVLTAAKDLGFGAHFTGDEMNVFDDHISLINAGVPAIDLIDFQYPDASNRYWHTLADTPDKCSAQSLTTVGETVLRVVYGF